MIRERHGKNRAFLSMVIIAFIAFNTAISYFLESIGFDILFILVVFFPVIEELAKFYLAVNHKNIVVSAITIFAIIELLVIKTSNIFLFSYPYFYIFYDFIVFIFHLSTAYLYASNGFIRYKYFLLLLMTAIHSTYNLLPDIIYSDLLRIFINLVIIAFVLFLGRVLQSYGDTCGLHPLGESLSEKQVG